MGVSIKNKHILWIFGPFKFGKFTGLKHELGRGVAVFQNQVTTPWRRECVDSLNIATKAWNSGPISGELHHDLTHHQSVFCAIAIITQLCIQNSEPIEELCDIKSKNLN